MPIAEPIVILAARRTPIGRFLGSLREHAATALGQVAVRAVLADVPEARPDRVIFGCARQAGVGPNPARQVLRLAGLPDSTVAVTVNMACASGMEAVAAGARALALGEAEWVVAGGMESMSRVPYLLDRARGGYRLGHAPLVDGMFRDGFLCPLSGKVMGETAETLASRYGIPREEQDAFAHESQRRAAAAQRDGAFDQERAAVELSRAVGGGVLETDEHPRPDTTPETLARLAPVFETGGTVTAGNASGIADGAAALLLARESTARKLGLPPRARIVSWASVGVDPEVMGIGPVPAVRKLCEETGLALDSFDLVEMNEAFAAQVLAVDRDLSFDRSRLNVHGGAIALGHPIGASGARILVTLLHAMERRGVRRGLATLCVSGGLGMAMALDRAGREAA